jgi:hypothetical protein
MLMRTLHELLNTAEPAWPLVQSWLREATNALEVLPPSDPARAEALVATQVTTCSPIGAVIYETGGLLVDHGWDLSPNEASGGVVRRGWLFASN